jgi:hypothetical protein
MKLTLLALVGASSWVLSAAAPVGVITSAAPFRLSGTVVPVAGAPSWPLAASDEVETGDAGAVLVLADGSRAVLAKHTRVSLERQPKGVRVRLRKGSMSFVLAPSASTSIAGLALEALPTIDSSGTLWIHRNSAHYGPTPGAGAGAPVVSLNPLNLAYLEALRGYEPGQLAGTGPAGGEPPAAPPPPVTSGTSGPPPSVSAFKPHP